MFQVVTFRPRFREDFRKLNENWIMKYFSLEEKDRYQLENPEICLANGGQIFFVVHRDKAVATCALYFTANGCYELAKMAVDDRFKGRGLASLMMEQIETWVRSVGGREIFLLSNSSLRAAIGLYRKHGYEVFHQGSHPDYDRADIGMRKKLNDPIKLRD